MCVLSKSRTKGRKGALSIGTIFVNKDHKNTYMVRLKRVLFHDMKQDGFECAILLEVVSVY